jgi:hypothetical protein
MPTEDARHAHQPIHVKNANDLSTPRKIDWPRMSEEFYDISCRR